MYSQCMSKTKLRAAVLTFTRGWESTRGHRAAITGSDAKWPLPRLFLLLWTNSQYCVIDIFSPPSIKLSLHHPPFSGSVASAMICRLRIWSACKKLRDKKSQLLPGVRADVRFSKLFYRCLRGCKKTNVKKTPHKQNPEIKMTAEENKGVREGEFSSVVIAETSLSSYGLWYCYWFHIEDTQILQWCESYKTLRQMTAKI